MKQYKGSIVDAATMESLKGARWRPQRYPYIGVLLHSNSTEFYIRDLIQFDLEKFLANRIVQKFVRSPASLSCFARSDS